MVKATPQQMVPDIESRTVLRQASFGDMDASPQKKGAAKAAPSTERFNERRRRR
jgi:hypothetical protein